MAYSALLLERTLVARTPPRDSLACCLSDFLRSAGLRNNEGVIRELQSAVSRLIAGSRSVAHPGGVARAMALQDQQSSKCPYMTSGCSNNGIDLTGPQSTHAASSALWAR